MHQAWTSAPGVPVVEEYVFSYEEDSDRRVTQTGEQIITTRIAIRRHAELRDFSYLAIVDGPFEAFVGVHNPEVSPDGFDADLRDFFGADGENWSNLRPYAYWDYEPESQSLITHLMAVHSRSRESLAVCDIVEADGAPRRFFDDVRGGCGLYTQVAMLDSQLATMSVVEAVEFFSRRRGPFSLIAGNIGFSDGTLVVDAFHRPERTAAGAGGYRGQDPWMRLTQGASSGLGPRISCQIDSSDMSRFSDLGTGDLLTVSVRLIEVSGGRFNFECS